MTRSAKSVEMRLTAIDVMATMRSAVAAVFFGAVAIGVELVCAELVGSPELVELVASSKPEEVAVSSFSLFSNVERPISRPSRQSFRALRRRPWARGGSRSCRVADSLKGHMHLPKSSSTTEMLAVSDPNGPGTTTSSKAAGTAEVSAPIFSNRYCALHPTAQINTHRQAVACPRAAQKTATLRSLRSAQWQRWCHRPAQ
jgi:hypothetical protein